MAKQKAENSTTSKQNLISIVLSSDLSQCVPEHGVPPIHNAHTSDPEPDSSRRSRSGPFFRTESTPVSGCSSNRWPFERSCSPPPDAGSTSWHADKHRHADKQAPMVSTQAAFIVAKPYLQLIQNNPK
ncbi:uncharacterized protein LOC119766233 [Culex quinquefasciatus]|uniref:uncharacterized protein LOC119766233 n=1 Tax=Culex quinquefasciatus TaxID=7176 RepID=UPI0018E38A17|nr:uncharacterized protein LOC119766233 [Culex quinquefasciatus]